MDALNEYRTLIKQIFEEYSKVPYAYGDVQSECVFDTERDRYLLLTMGWENGLRVHATLVHIEIIGDKIWIQRDGTETGIAAELTQAGIPKERIVLGFRPPEVRQYTEYAVA